MEIYFSHSGVWKSEIRVSAWLGSDEVLFQVADCQFLVFLLGRGSGRERELMFLLKDSSTLMRALPS